MSGKADAKTFGTAGVRGQRSMIDQQFARKAEGDGPQGQSGVLSDTMTYNDTAFYTKKRAKEAELGRELTTEEFLADHYVPSELPTASGTSIFDPVLCEIAYRWFSPPDGTVLDPFAGGSVRGLIASKLGRRYIGIELRGEQVEANRAQAHLGGDIAPEWIEGDSRQIKRLAGHVSADLIFSCPPYWNLEVYSDDPNDLSTMAKEPFFEAYGAIIKAAVDQLKPDRFAVWVIGDVRDAKGFFANLPGRTIELFEAAGARFYNDGILVTAVGSLPIRAGRQFEVSRKLGRTHQNVLVFVKGDPKRATEACGAVEFGDLEAEADPAAGEGLPE